ncbi:uncharacterized protein RSE6_14087 [Rhynchosporium secalis]|uniref:Uncharacterized protein n=1 Tax=Rhynchosporium secalis TaxID=38038 RepID=A0A1E1MUE6_RHYSE|nr:uncharacterized protein RSE6_14087 [Rhynchosporium secalis]
MAQVGQIQLSEASITPSDTLGVLITTAADPMQIDESLKIQVGMIDSVTSSPIASVGTESLIIEDDDVQILFSAPRRRKKRRRKFGSTVSASPLSQVCKPAAASYASPEMHHVVSQEASRRRSISVVQRLELCNLGEEISPTCRAGSLPAMPCAVNSSVADMQYPWFADSSYDESSFPQFPPLTDYAAWWDQSLPTVQSRALPSIRWRPLQTGNLDPKKRKLDESFDEPRIPSSQLHSSVQVSPRTTPVSAISSTILRPCPIHASPYDVYESCQHFPSANLWPEPEWDEFQRAGHDHNGLQSISQSSVPTNFSTQNSIVSRKSSVGQTYLSNRFESRVGDEAMLQYAGQATLIAPLNLNSNSTTQLHRPSNKGEQAQQLRLLPPYSRLYTLPPSAGTLSHTNSSQMPSPVVLSQSGLPPNVRAIAPFIRPCSDARVTQLDILRKPSLYSIPSWGSPSKGEAIPAQSAIVQSHIRPELSGDSEAIQARSTNVGSRYLSSILPPSRIDAETIAKSASMQPAKAKYSSPVREDSNPCVTNFRIPKARLTRKHSPNLIIEIAETCQALFPFAEVAQRQEVPIQKVYDIFSAIIQLPLLRNADDRRRHSSLAKRRVKEYRDAKRAMEKAQETEKKANMRARVEGAAKTCQDHGRGPGLLNSAVLRNAREMYRVD